MTAFAFIVVLLIGYQFGRWVRDADITATNYDYYSEVQRLRSRVAELEEEIRQHDAEEGTVTFQ